MSSLYFTKHCIERMSKRHITTEDIQICISFGNVLYKTGLKYYIISKKIIRDNNLPEKLNGLCVLVSGDNYIITAFKNSRVLSYAKALSKIDFKKSYFGQGAF